jgi:cell division protein FtsL
MNVAIRVLTQGNLVQSNVVSKTEALTFPVIGIKVLVLIFLILLSSLAMVYAKDLNRRLFIHYQDELSNVQRLETDMGNLLLEQSSWSQQARMQQVAEQELDMKLPTSANVVVVKL